MFDIYDLLYIIEEDDRGYNVKQRGNGIIIARTALRVTAEKCVDGLNACGVLNDLREVVAANN